MLGRRLIVLAGVVGAFVLFGWVALGEVAESHSPAESQTVAVLTETIAADIYTGRRAGQGVVNVSNQAVFGPHICTAYGDPFSPLTTIDGSPNPYWPIMEGTYHYRIAIPPDYPHDIVRVELFDPDSMNRDGSGSNVQVHHTSTYIDPDGDGDPDNPLSHIASCTGSGTNRKHPCLIPTGETSVVGPTYGHTIDDINLFWFFRIDENRGHGAPPGNGLCGEPPFYSIGHNTSTRFELHYQQVVSGSEPVRTALAAYTGQTGDARDGGAMGDHLTDLRWASPGGPQAFDYPAGVEVPTDCGSLTGGDYDPVTCPGGSVSGPGKGFEISLSQHMLDVVVDETTGYRYLYLDVTALSGSSENGFEIWAGPPVYTSTIASDVNIRNLQATNNSPGAPAPAGLVVTAIGSLPVNSNYVNHVEIPLTYIGPEYAGQVISVTLFDTDSGAQPPVVFFFDSLAFTPDTSANRIDETSTDWALAFGVAGEPDPDGGTGRCTLGTTCNNNWITPAYQIRVPELSPECDFSDPDPAICTPFYGGRLMAYHSAGSGNKYNVMVGLPEVEELEVTAGCSAFPISLEESIHSVNGPPDVNVPNSYPYWDTFDNENPPSYYDFPYHVDDVPLLEAEAGYIYRLYDGVAAAGFNWLNWNEYISASAATLEDALTWPGNSMDYTTVIPGPPPPGWPHRFPGFLEYGDPTDATIHVNDRVQLSVGISGAQVDNVLDTHIELGRYLRLPIWRYEEDGYGSQWVKMVSFAVFRLHGYQLSSAGNGPWLLLEFRHWDESCGQVEELPITPTPSVTPSLTPTWTPTPSPTPTASNTPTQTPTASQTPTPTIGPTVTPSPSATASNTPTYTPTAEPSQTATLTPTPTQAASATPSPTATPTQAAPAGYLLYLPVVTGGG